MAGGAPGYDKQTQRWFSRRHWGPSAVWQPGPFARSCSASPGAVEYNPCLVAVEGEYSRAWLGTRGRGTEGDFDLELLLV